MKIDDYEIKACEWTSLVWDSGREYMPRKGLFGYILDMFSKQYIQVREAGFTAISGDKILKSPDGITWTTEEEIK